MSGLPALYECEITHVRTTPVENVFKYRTYLWLVDLDALPSRGPFGVFSSLDHCGDPSLGLRENAEAFLAEHGLAPPARILMLCHARVFGYVFNPLTVYWCQDAEGRPLATIAEVHNTYGGRYRYLLRADRQGRAEAAKGFYVSPFLPVEGLYRLHLPEPSERLSLTISLNLPGSRPFLAGVRGIRRAATWPRLLAAFLRHPLAPLAGAVRIRIQGIGLLLRGVPRIPRQPPNARRET